LIAISHVRGVQAMLSVRTETAQPPRATWPQKTKYGAIDMFQAKELAREKGCKKERSADPAAERQYDAVIQQARRAPERTRCHAASNRRAVLIWECSGRFDVFVAAASRDIIRDTKAAIAPRKNEGATAFEKICVSLSMSGTNSILQLLGLRLWA
jgi:hypothetical protein